MGLSLGIVGLPNVGKSTLFNAITRAGALAANFPFATIDKNVGVVAVPDPRLDRLAPLFRRRGELPPRVPTSVQFVDIAGLVRGAHRGEGLGNQFLAHIREVDAIVEVVRCFEDPNIVHIGGKVDPDDDMEIIATELILADLASLERRVDRLRKSAKGRAEAAELLGDAEQLLAALEQGRPARSVQLEGGIPSELELLTAKPVIYAANVSEADLAPGSEAAAPVRRRAEREGARWVAVSAQLESELAELPPEEAASFLADFGVSEGGLQALIRVGYDTLGLITFLTAGEKEVRAWTVRRGALAPQAAGVIHSDFERGFIRAEVIAFEDFVHYRGESGAREAGKMRLEGKEYRVRDGDVMHFRFNV